jgi:lipoprotein NlpD
VTDKSTAEVPVQVKARSPADAYRVKPGDTLYSIAFEAGVDYRDLAAWNGIEFPDRIRSGQRLRLSAPVPAPPANTAPPQFRPPALKAVEPEAGIKWSWPAEGTVVQEFGGVASNRGVEIAGREGTPVRAAAPGRIVYAGSGLRGYGELIIVKHNETYLSAYAHNRRLLVREGQTVKAGQTIAEMGATGVTQVKLHFEIRRRGVPVDPLTFLPRR